jgi:hypothetical protein
MKKTTFLLLSLFALGSARVHAIHVQPASTEVVMSTGTGEVTEGQVEVTNDLQDRMLVTAFCKNWFLQEPYKDLPVDAWLKIGKSSFTLEPGQTETVPFTVRMPQSSTPPAGVFVGMLSFQPEMEGKGQSVSLTMSVSVYLTVRGTQKYEGVLKDFGLRRSGSQFQGALVVENKGNMHLSPTGRVEFFNRKGRMVFSIPFERGRPAYPGRTRSYGGQIPWNQVKKGAYRAKILMQLGNQTVEENHFLLIKKDGTVETLPEKKSQRWPRRKDGSYK